MKGAAMTSADRTDPRPYDASQGSTGVTGLAWAVAAGAVLAGYIVEWLNTGALAGAYGLWVALAGTNVHGRARGETPELMRSNGRSRAETRWESARCISTAFQKLSTTRRVRNGGVLRSAKPVAMQGLHDGRTWDRTRDLPRVKRALSR